MRGRAGRLEWVRGWRTDHGHEVDFVVVFAGRNRSGHPFVALWLGPLAIEVGYRG